MAIKKFSDGTPAPAVVVKAQDGTPAPAIKRQDGTPAPALIEQEDQVLAMTPEQKIAANPTATQTGPYLAEKARLSAQEDFNKANAPRPATATGRTWIAQGLAKKRLDEENANVAAWDKRMAIPVRSYPTLAKAMALDPTLTEADVRRVVNLASAWTTAEAIEAQETEQGRMNILLSLPPMQRFAVSDILISRANAQEDSYERARRDARLAEEEKATWGPAKQLAAGFDRGVVELATGFMDTVNTIYEGTQQALATSADAYFKNKRENGAFSTFAPSLTGDANIVTDLFTRWDEHELGNYEDSVIAQAREVYGSIPVDLILEIKQAANEGDPNPIMTVSQRHLNDPERAEYISLLTKRVIDDPEKERLQKELIILEEKIDSAAINDPGAIVTTHDWFSGEPIDIENSWRESMARVGLSKAFNVTAALVLDPTIAFSKGVRIAKGVRYGLEQIASVAGAQSVQDALTMPEVYRYVNRMTDDVSKYISMRSAGEDTAKFGRVLDERYKAYFDPSVIADMVKANVTTPEAFIAYVQNTNRMAQIARGQVAGMYEVGILTKNQANKQIADIEGNTVFGRMYGQQGARRSKPLLPGSSILANTTRIPEISRTVSNFVQQIGPKKSRQQAVSRLFGEANDDTKSFAMLMNENADTLGRNARLFADDSGVAGNVAAAWDKTTRLFSTTPGTAAIYTKDARDTGIFYKFARMHLPKHQAQLLADEWRNGTQAERVLMWIGTVRTATYARGFEDISDMVLRLPDGTVTNVGDYVKTLNVGTRQDVLFSPQSIEVFNGESFVNLDTYMGLSSSAGDNVGTIGNDVIRRSPSDFGGIQHPLHLWQTSDYLAVPNMNELQRITKRNALVNAVRRNSDGRNYATEVVNWWSLLNLAGPRYATRNAFEDIGLYALTGGYLMDFVKGAAAAKGIREARGMKPGILSRLRRKTGGEAKPGDPDYSVWEHVFKPQLSKQEVAQARAAAEDGDLVALRQLALKATVRLEAGRLLSVEEERYLVDFLSSHAAFAKLDEVSQTTYYAAAGVQPGIDVSTTPVRGIVGTDEVRIYPRGQYTNIALSGSAGTSGLDAGRFVYWHRNIRNTILADGRIGQIAMQNLDNPDQATRLIAQELSNPRSAEYKQRLAAFFDVRVNVSDDEFARRYVQDVYNTFSRKDGSFNRDLWSRFVLENEDGTRTVRFATNTTVDSSISPNEIIKQAISLNPKKKNLKEILSNIENGNYGEKELDFFDSIVATVAYDDAGKLLARENTSGAAVLARALSGDKAAQKSVDARLAAYRKNVAEKSESTRVEQTGTYKGNVEPADYGDFTVVHSTKYDVTRNAAGDVVLNPNAKFTSGSARSSIHFTVNSEVQGHMFGQWDDTNKLIVSNAGDAVAANGKPAALSAIDSWWKLNPGKDLVLPKASVVTPFIDEVKYAKELEKRGLIKPGEKPPVIIEDASTGDVYYLSKNPNAYTDADREQIITDLKGAGWPANKESIVGKESEVLRRGALDLAMRQQRVTTGPEALEQWDFAFNKGLSERIDSLRSREGIYGGIHQGTPAAQHELSTGIEGYNRFGGGELETYRWLAAKGMFKPEKYQKWDKPISVDDLRNMKIEDMPQYILGRETSPIAVSVKMGVDDKLWTMMGNVVSRISKEPIFMANYFRARKQLLPYEERLIAEVGPDLARETVTRHAVDRATAISLSYTDNPANQTIIAWRLRNWARYYRATEDFYRRVYRMGKFEPIGFYKAALTLNALEDQGFVYNDDYGDKYFIYPGDGLVNTVVGSVLAKLGGNDLLVGSAPLIFGGKVKMLAPSLDPKAAIPTLSGPISAISMKFIFSAFPQLRALEKYTLGEYSVDKTVVETSFSASIVRFLAALDTNERESIFASAYMSAAKVLTAAGKMPELADGMEDEANEALTTVANNIIWTKFAAGFVYQAIPQIMENDVTTFAREYGIPSMSGDYKDRVQKYREAGETDPYGMALQEGISIFGPSYTAYDVSEFEGGKELKSLPELNYVDDLFGFIENNEKLVKEYPASAYFLAPQTAGELSIPALRYYEDKELRNPKSYKDYAKELLYSKGKYYYYDIMRWYRDSVASADGPGAEADAKNKKNLALTELFSDFPGLQQRVKGTIDLANWEEEAINRNNPDSVRRMVDDYYDGKFGPVPNSVKYIAEAMNTYDYFTTEKNKISGSSEPEKLAKNSYETALLRSLQSIAEDDPNAEMFIRKVLYVLLDADSEGNPK